MPSRRRVLRSLSLAAAGLAGCGGARESATRSPTDVPTTSPSATPTDRPTESPTASPTAVTCDAWDPTVRWSIPTAIRAFAPTAHGDAVYFGSQDGSLRAVDAATGRVRWRVEQSGSLYARPRVSDGVVTYRGYDAVVALDAADGEAMWSFSPPGDHAVVRAIADDGTTVYAGASQHPGTEYEVDEEYDRVYALDRRTGERAFVADVAAPDGWVPPDELAAGGDRVFVGAHSGETLSLDAGTGKVLWRTALGDSASDVAVGDGTVYRQGGHRLVALDPETGRERWTADGCEATPAVGDHVFCAGGDTLAAFDPDTGEEVWDATVPGGTRGEDTAVVDGHVFQGANGSGDGSRLYAYDASSGCRRGFASTNSASVTRPALAGGTLWFGGLNGEGRLWGVTPP